jgi:tripartite-type tricarboxylate transporter receptor subunit TctC
VLDKLQSAIQGAMTETDLPATYLAQGGLPTFRDRDAFRKVVTEDRERLGALIRSVGVRLD